MPAQVQLDRRGEPTQLIVVAGLDEEGGDGEVVLPGDELQGLLLQPMVQRADHGRISREDGPSEGVDVERENLQGLLSLTNVVRVRISREPGSAGGGSPRVEVGPPAIEDVRPAVRD